MVPNLTVNQSLQHHIIITLFDYIQLEECIVNKHSVSDFDKINCIAVVDSEFLLISKNAGFAHPDCVILFKVHSPILKFQGSEFRSFGIVHNGQGLIVLSAYLPYDINHIDNFVMCGMAEINPCTVHTHFDHFTHNLNAIACRTYAAYNFCFFHPILRISVMF